LSNTGDGGSQAVFTCNNADPRISTAVPGDCRSCVADRNPSYNKVHGIFNIDVPGCGMKVLICRTKMDGQPCQGIGIRIIVITASPAPNQSHRESQTRDQNQSRKTCFLHIHSP
jgi:hypothetical protein